MNKKKGWVSVDRKIKDHFIWEPNRARTKTEAWLDLLLRANHQDKDWVVNDKVIQIKRGEVVTSMKQLASDWKWSRQKVKRFLTLIASCDMIVMKVNQSMSRLSICNYETYQGGVTTHVTTDTHQTPTKHPQLNKVNKANKVNKTTLKQSAVNNSFAIKFIKLWTPEGWLVNPPTPYENKEIIQYGMNYNDDIEYWRPFLEERQKRIKRGEFHHNSIKSFCGGAFRTYTKESRLATKPKQEQFRPCKSGGFIAYCSECGHKSFPNEYQLKHEGPNCHPGRSFVASKPKVVKKKFTKNDAKMDKEILAKVGYAIG